MLVVAVVIKVTFPQIFQSPAVNDIDVILAFTLVVKATAEPEGIMLDIISPTTPADALLLVVVPIMPPVEGEKVKLVAVAFPRIGVINVGDVAKTGAPLPVNATQVGTPPAVVVNTELLTTETPLILFAEELYKSSLIVVEAG